ncbi:MAG: DNA mismatch repair endonuclease MutL [Thermomicrobiales bacterium]
MGEGQAMRAVPQAAIRVLPASVAASIAAGEVIERPASVVKELVENALDAGAVSIRIDTGGGGVVQIRVMDDGIGIPAPDLWLACQRHATSKLGTDDLRAVRTLGFRGEALPSIANVAELTIVSAVDDSGVGQKIVVRDNAMIVNQPAPRTRGTTVSVFRLFERMPARLASMLVAKPENSAIGQTVRRLALTAPQVAITLAIDGRINFRTTGSGDLCTVLGEIYGAELITNLDALDETEIGGARLSGVLAAPHINRPGRGQVNIIVNGRWVQPRGLIPRIEAGYRPVLPRGRHPVAALVVETAPELVDINIHPSKLEVRLREERVIGQALGELVHTMLGRRPHLLHSGFELGAITLQPAATIAETTPAYDDSLVQTPSLPPLRLIGQVRSALMLCEGPEGLYLIDQHRAHERIIFERLKAVHSRVEEPEPLAEPLLIELRPAQIARFSRRIDDLATLGFQCESFGGRTFLLRTAPVLPGVTSVRADGVEAALTGLGEIAELGPALLDLPDEEAGEGEDWQQRLLVNLSCRTAVRRGRALEPPTMRALIEGLGQTASPAVCPHGSPLLMHVSADLLERQFDWR